MSIRLMGAPPLSPCHGRGRRHRKLSHPLASWSPIPLREPVAERTSRRTPRSDGSAEPTPVPGAWVSGRWRVIDAWSRRRISPRWGNLGGGPGSRMVRLTAAFAATALAPQRWHKPRAVAGGCLEELRNLRKIRHRAGQGGELAAELIVLPPGSMDVLISCKAPAGHVDQSASVTPAGGVQHRRSLPEMKPGSKLPSRLEQGRCSHGAIPHSEQVPFAFDRKAKNPGGVWGLAPIKASLFVQVSNRRDFDG
jgi:hypothetical protein